MARLADNELNFTYPPGWEDLTDERKLKLAKKAEALGLTGTPVEENSLGSFAVAGVVEKAMSKNGRKKSTGLPASVGRSGYVKHGRSPTKKT